MVGPTIAIAALFSLCAVIVRPGAAAGLIVASLLIWPEYLRIPMGPIQMSATRIVACVVLMRLLFSGRQELVKWSWPDALIILHYLWNIVAAVTTNAEPDFRNEMIGRAFDTVIIYFAARLAFTTLADLRSLIFPLALCAVTLGILGAMEALTSRSPYQTLIRYHTWIWVVKDPDYRLGMLRAFGSASHPIYFGIMMSMLTGILWALRPYAKSKQLHLCFILFALIGCLSSLSSGPMMGLVSLIILCSFYYFPSLIYPALGCLIAASVFVEFASTRHFYNLIDYLALNKGTSWYRTRLLEVAWANLGEYWAVGVGSNFPHHWGQQIDTRQHVDVVNNFIIVALNGGLLGLALYCGSAIGSIRNAIRCYKQSTSKSHRVTSFCLACTVIAILVASMSVGLFGGQMIMYYFLIAMTMSLRPVRAVVRGTRKNPSPQEHKSISTGPSIATTQPA
ncbi:MAG: hypothetical protein R3B58_02715 [Phycisphaerales bacterium]